MTGLIFDDNDLAVLARRLEAPVRHAGDCIMQFYQQPPDTDIKSDGSPVTEADRAAEAILLSAIRALAPDIPIISEENPASHKLPPVARFFLVDPLDGTREFIRPGSRGAFTVNIGLIEDRVPVMGIIYAPALGRLFFGSRHRGAFECGENTPQTIAVRRPVAGARVAVASASHRDSKTNDWLAAQHISKTIAIGSSLKFCLVAAGEADAYPRYGPTMEWDTAAGDAILRASGGRVEAADGTPFTYGKPGYRNGPFFAFGAI